jgi:hypothetical protein
VVTLSSPAFRNGLSVAGSLCYGVTTMRIETARHSNLPRDRGDQLRRVADDEFDGTLVSAHAIDLLGLPR